MSAIQILSDLHLESPRAYDIFNIVPRAPYLALLGDIGNIVPHREELLAFLTRQLQQFRAVLLVPGNHEAYGGTWPEALSILEKFEQSNTDGQFVLLNRSTFELPDQAIILGCSLFSHIPSQSEMAVAMGLQDFFQTSEWSASAHNEAHARDLAWLNGQVSRLQRKNSNAKIVILTHWSPTTDSRSLDPRHSGSLITAGFATDLSGESCFKSSNVVVWGFGHTHFNCDFLVDRGETGPLRLLTNQRGYYFSQAEGFDESKVIELG